MFFGANLIALDGLFFSLTTVLALVSSGCCESTTRAAKKPMLTIKVNSITQPETAGLRGFFLGFRLA
jgi:hypothetical protein